MLKLEIFHLKNINEHYKNENKDIEINFAKEREKLSESIESQKVESVKLERTHHILKDLYETQHKKHYNLLQAKESLEEALKDKESEIQKNTTLCKTCVFCQNAFKTRGNLTKHKKTMYSQEY